jgi:murein DD-endopeptidase MepM/ murein hydrolase activator NlpD
MPPPRPSSSARPARGWRLPLLALVLAVGTFLPTAAPASVARPAEPPPPAGPDPPRVPALWMPVAGTVVRGFDARAGPYGPGHRGIDIAATVGEPVRAPAAGTVRFAGPVAGTTWVTLQVAPGVLVTLGPLLDPVSASRVRLRALLGRVGPGHPGGGAGGVTLHLGVRVDGVYVDPLAYLVDRPRARLAPLPTPGGLPGG